MALVQLFAKPPVPGKVKTRLLADIGAKKATRVYRYCLAHALAVLNASQLNFEVWLSETSSDPLFVDLHCQLQQGNDLGERMFHALSQSLTARPKQPVILIGSDCLEINPAHLAQALESLTIHDLVFLPCVDGGFALIGCRKIEKWLFDRVAWSSETVLQKILMNAKTLNYSVHLLETVRDVDTLQDLNHYPELRKLIAKN